MSSFQVGASTATFTATINGSRQATQDNLPSLTLGLYFATAAEWDVLYSLLTTMYAIHAPMANTAVVLDVVRGPGTGTLTVDNLGIWTALMISCERAQYVPHARSLGTATFLLTEALI